MKNGRDKIRIGITSEGAAGGEHLVEDAAKTEDVGASVSSLTPSLLRRHVGRRTENNTGAGLEGERSITGGVRRGKTSQTEIKDLYLAIRTNKNVVRLNVPVNDTLFVGSAKATSDLGGNLDRLALRKWAGLEALAQGFSFQQFGDDEGEIVVVADVENGQNVGVIELPACTGLTLEA